MVIEAATNPERFLGRRLLFLHTGGLLGALGHPELAESLAASVSGVTPESV